MGERGRRSIRRELLLVLLTVVSISWIAAALASFVDARHEVSEVLDAHLTQTASLVMRQRDGTNSVIETEHTPALHRYSRQLMFQVWENGSVLRLHSQNAPNGRLSPVQEGFSDATIGTARWRVFSAWDTQRRTLVQTAEQLSERDELTTSVARNFILPLVVALPILALMIRVAVGRATRSLTDVNQQVASRAGDSLAPLDIANAPLEIDALVLSLNQLFARVRGSMERERQFTADAAHELRTPLAAIRAQAQVAQGASSDTERIRALGNVMGGCDRATHAVEQMLTLARLAPEAVSFHPVTVDVGEVLKASMIDLVPAALSKEIEIELIDQRGATAAGEAGLLGILFRNVIDNAIRYSAPRTRVQVSVARVGSDTQIAVSDAGPGIPADERIKIGRRFYRGPATQASGSGLGLSIAQRIVELHGGAMRFDTPAAGVGLQVTIVLPRTTIAT